MVISEVGGAAEGAAIWRRWQMQGPQQASAWLALPSDSRRMRLDHPDDHPDDPSVSVWSHLAESASNVNRLDPSGAVQADAEHPTRNRKVVGSNPTSDSKTAGQRPFLAWLTAQRQQAVIPLGRLTVPQTRPPRLPRTIKTTSLRARRHSRIHRLGIRTPTGRAS